MGNKKFMQILHFPAVQHNPAFYWAEGTISLSNETSSQHKINYSKPSVFQTGRGLDGLTTNFITGGSAAWRTGGNKCT